MLLSNHDFAGALSRALARMYNEAAGAEHGLLKPAPVARGRKLLEELGYPGDLLDQVPEDLLAATFPCACPLPEISRLAPARMLDLGCGGGLDLVGAARSAAAIEKLYGIDSSPVMLAAARRLSKLFPALEDRISLAPGDLNQPGKLPLIKVDLILMNGSFNLVYDKTALLGEIRKRLAPGGRLLLLDLFLTEALPAGFADDIDNWLWNIGGALGPDELSAAAAESGLAVVEYRELERIDPVARGRVVLTTT